MHTLNVTLRRKRVMKSQARDVHELIPKLEAVLQQYQGCQAIPIASAVVLLYREKIEDKFEIKTGKGLLKVHLYDAGETNMRNVKEEMVHNNIKATIVRIQNRLIGLYSNPDYIDELGELIQNDVDELHLLAVELRYEKAKKIKDPGPVTNPDVVNFLIANERKTVHIARMVLMGTETLFVVNEDGKVVNFYGEKK